MGVRSHHLSAGTWTVGALVVVVASTLLLLFGSKVEEIPPTSIAFIGNSFQFSNDLPRTIEAMGEGKITQDSTLHGSLWLGSIMERGNGMWNRWAGQRKVKYPKRDFGSCTVHQLLLGYDDYLYDYQNYYKVDGKNPCFLDQKYLNHTLNTRNRSSWDFVVYNDQSMRPSKWWLRNDTVEVLVDEHLPLLLEIGATPVFIETWGYWRPNRDMTLFESIPHFSSLLKEGYQAYADALAPYLPEEQQPRIAPVGSAFLLLWEENYNFWHQMMFQEDRYHPSPHGTYLEACIIYITLFNRLPPISSRFTDKLFERARCMQVEGATLPLPTEGEAIYLRWIAKRIAFDGEVPKSLDLNPTPLEYAYG